MTTYENVLAGNSFDEIIFTNRNKEYGAYMLRKKQKGYLIIAFFIAFATITSSVVTPLIINRYKGNGQNSNLPPTYQVKMDTTITIELPKPPEINIERMASTLSAPVILKKPTPLHHRLILWTNFLQCRLT